MSKAEEVAELVKIMAKDGIHPKIVHYTDEEWAALKAKGAETLKKMRFKNSTPVKGKTIKFYGYNECPE